MKTGDVQTLYFLDILLRQYKLVTLGILCMPGDVHPKQQYQVVGNFDVLAYLHVKNQLVPSLLSLDITLKGILHSDWLTVFQPVT